MRCDWTQATEETVCLRRKASRTHLTRLYLYSRFLYPLLFIPIYKAATTVRAVKQILQKPRASSTASPAAIEYWEQHRQVRSRRLSTIISLGTPALRRHDGAEGKQWSGTGRRRGLRVLIR